MTFEFGKSNGGVLGEYGEEEGEQYGGVEEVEADGVEAGGVEVEGYEEERIDVDEGEEEENGRRMIQDVIVADKRLVGGIGDIFGSGGRWFRGRPNDGETFSKVDAPPTSSLRVV